MRIKISTVGEQVLRQRALALTSEEIRSKAIRDLIDHMRETMRDAPGVGLAAPQIGISLQLAVIEDRPEYHKAISESEMKEREREPVPFHVLINPKIQLLSAPDAEFFEGCLSLPGFTAVVPRARQVRVECLNDEGEPVTIQASGWYARILQHEIDHLHGTLYIDRMYSRSFSSLENHTRYWKDKTLKDIVPLFKVSPET